MTVHRTRLAALALAASLATPAFAQYSTPMRDVENPDRTRLVLTGFTSFEAPFINAFINFTTPAMKRYFIDEVSLSCSLNSPGDSLGQVSLLTQQNNGTASTYGFQPVIMTRTGPSTFGGSVYGGSLSTKIFHDATPTSQLYLNIFHTQSSSDGNCSATLVAHTLP